MLSILEAIITFLFHQMLLRQEKWSKTVESQALMYNGELKFWTVKRNSKIKLYTKHENGPKQHLDSDLAVNEPPLAAEERTPLSLSLSIVTVSFQFPSKKSLWVSLSALSEWVS